MQRRRVFTDTSKTEELFADAGEEMTGYLTSAGGRFFRTLDLVAGTASPSEGAVLEIGANPYFVTAVLLHDLKLSVTCMGRPAVVWPGSPAALGSERRLIEVNGSSYPLEEVVCNAEREPFPFEDQSFDLVIAAEILEHLIYSPTQFLYEIHRVLKPGGRLVLTTPNAIQMRYLLRWFRGRSVWDQYSGYGVYGRHQREYTPREVRSLLESINFTVEMVDVYYGQRLDHPWLERAASAAYHLFPGRQPEMTFLARATGSPRVSYPPFLYRSLYPEPKDVGAMYAYNRRDEVK